MAEKNVTRTFRGRATNWIRKEMLLVIRYHTVQEITWKFNTCLQILFVYQVSWVCLVLYQCLQIKKRFIKKILIFSAFRPYFSRKAFYPNCTKCSENMKKYIERIVLKFKAITIYIHRDMNIFSKYFLTVLASMHVCEILSEFHTLLYASNKKQLTHRMHC